MKAYHISGNIDSDDLLPLLAEAAGELGLILHGREEGCPGGFALYRGTCGKGTCAAFIFPGNMTKENLPTLKAFIRNHPMNGIENLYFFIGRNDCGWDTVLASLRDASGSTGQTIHLISYVFMMRGREPAVAFEVHGVSLGDPVFEPLAESMRPEISIAPALRNERPGRQEKFRLTKEEISDFIDIGLALRGLALR